MQASVTHSPYKCFKALYVHAKWLLSKTVVLITARPVNVAAPEKVYQIFFAYVTECVAGIQY